MMISGLINSINQICEHKSVCTKTSPVTLLIYGCGGHCRSVLSVVKEIGVDTLLDISIIDDNAQEDELIYGIPVKKCYKDEADKGVFFIVAVGDNSKRKILFEEKKLYFTPVSAISPHAHITDNAYVGAGCFVGCNSYIGPEAVIGDNTIINTGAIIEHEVKIGSHSHIAPNSTVCGRSRIGDEVFVGAGSTVIDNITICNNVVVGAGSVVVKDILESGVYAGVPAKRHF